MKPTDKRVPHRRSEVIAARQKKNNRSDGAKRFLRGILRKTVVIVVVGVIVYVAYHFFVLR